MTTARYLLSEAVDNIKANRTTTVTAVVTTAFTMLGMGVFLLLYMNVQDVLGSLREEIKVIVYFRDTVSPEEIAALEVQLREDPAVSSIEFVSREQALVSFRTRFPSEERLLNGLGENPFPASLVLKIGPRFRTSQAVTELVKKLQALPEVEEVLYNRSLIENLAAGLRYLRLLGLLVGTVLAASMVTILANTTRLTLYARREDIEILRLIGATPGFGSRLLIASVARSIRIRGDQNGAARQLLGSRRRPFVFTGAVDDWNGNPGDHAWFPRKYCVAGAAS